MNARRKTPFETAPGLGWARRVLRQQLDALARLTAIAWRLCEPPAPVAESSDPAAFLAALRRFDRAARRQVRVDWALRLIAALRARLEAELQALDNGQAPAPPAQPSSLAAEAAPAETRDPKHRPERPERDLRDHERFGFQGRDDRKLAAILERPTAEIIALICRELGLPEDWPRLAEDAWSREHPDEAVGPLRAREAGGIPGRPRQRSGSPSTPTVSSA